MRRCPDGAAIIAASARAMNADSDRDSEMRTSKQDHHRTSGRRVHIGVTARAGSLHSVASAAASVHELIRIDRLVRADDEVLYADAGDQGANRLRR